MFQRIKRLIAIVGVAGFMGVFLQFSYPTAEVNEPVINSKKQLPPFISSQSSWYDSVFKTLSLEEKIGQMLMVAAYPEQGEADKKRVASLIKNQKVGGVIFFQGTPQQVHELAKYYQSISDIPLLMAIDGEWGLRMRLKNSIKYPKQMTLGAITSDMLIYQMGQDIAQQLKHLGIHINFAPVVDINNNPENPVINARSFGEERVNVARKGLLYAKGMQDEGVLAFAKHFPGHGDTKTDSHYGLPIINYSFSRLDSLELYPFRALINAGVGGVMMAHMHIPALDSTKNLPSTLSPKIADSLLQKHLGFKGLVVTDAMFMKGVSDYYTPVEANLKAVQAGNNILLMPHEVPQSIAEIVNSAKSDSTLIHNINRSCEKVLKAKAWVMNRRQASEEFSNDSLFRPSYVYNRNRLVEAAVTVLKNENDLLPLRSLDTLKIASLAIGNSPTKEYVNSLGLYAKVDRFQLKDYTDSSEIKILGEKLSDYNLVVFSMHSNSLNAKKKFGFNRSELKVIDSLLTDIPSILVGLANPYALSWLPNLDKHKAILTVYENSDEAQLYAVQAIFGAIGATGRLPVTINSNYPVGHGIPIRSLDRLKYVTPFEAGFDERKLRVIDSIVNDAIKEKAMPGCQILAAKDGKVFLNRAFGYHTYRKKKEVKTSDLYDLASITKVAATVPSLIQLEQQKKIDINKTLSEYIPYLDTCAKGDIVLADVLLHQAGLAAWIPFYWATIEPVYPSHDLISTKYSKTYPIQVGKRAYANKHLKYKENYFSTEPDSVFSYQIANGMYMNKMFEDSIWYKIAATDLGEKGDYRYSDLGFYLFYKIIEQQSNSQLEDFTDSVFYSRLGAYTLGYRPLERFSKNEIIPTENDIVFRRQIVHGYVHDPGAAMLGGVSGHAGLFSNANDLAKLMQMYLNGGKYGGNYYLSRKLIKKYTDCPSCKDGNRRGLGFDKPQPDTTLPGPAFKGISTKSYGHTGFTGTMTWADPSTGILYIFLSNRVYPDALNFKLVKMDVRTKIQEAIYDAAL
jgi:beta-N-acetylhexosaminidase